MSNPVTEVPQAVYRAAWEAWAVAPPFCTPEQITAVILDAVWPLAVAHATRDEAAAVAEALRRAADSLHDARLGWDSYSADWADAIADLRYLADSLAPVSTPSGNETGDACVRGGNCDWILCPACAPGAAGTGEGEPT